jgi:hypothetical protein
VLSVTLGIVTALMTDAFCKVYKQIYTRLSIV